MREWLRRFMMGRNGQDDLNRFLSITALVLMIVSLFVLPEFIYPLATVLIVFCIYRMLSKNAWKRKQENEVYLRYRRKISGWFRSLKDMVRQRNTHNFYKCPSCKTKLRVPKGKGRIIITCPKCRTAIEKVT